MEYGEDEEEEDERFVNRQKIEEDVKQNIAVAQVSFIAL